MWQERKMRRRSCPSTRCIATIPASRRGCTVKAGALWLSRRKKPSSLPSPAADSRPGAWLALIFHAATKSFFSLREKRPIPQERSICWATGQVRPGPPEAQSSRMLLRCSIQRQEENVVILHHRINSGLSRHLHNFNFAKKGTFTACLLYFRNLLHNFFAGACGWPAGD